MVMADEMWFNKAHKSIRNAMRALKAGDVKYLLDDEVGVIRKECNNLGGEIRHLAYIEEKIRNIEHSLTVPPKHKMQFQEIDWLERSHRVVHGFMELQRYLQETGTDIIDINWVLSWLKEKLYEVASQIKDRRNGESPSNLLIEADFWLAATHVAKELGIDIFPEYRAQFDKLLNKAYIVCKDLYDRCAFDYSATYVDVENTDGTSSDGNQWGETDRILQLHIIEKQMREVANVLPVLQKFRKLCIDGAKVVGGQYIFSSEAIEWPSNVEEWRRSLQRFERYIRRMHDIAKRNILAHGQKDVDKMLGYSNPGGGVNLRDQKFKRHPVYEALVQQLRSYVKKRETIEDLISRLDRLLKIDGRVVDIYDVENLDSENSGFDALILRHVQEGGVPIEMFLYLLDSIQGEDPDNETKWQEDLIEHYERYTGKRFQSIDQIRADMERAVEQVKNMRRFFVDVRRSIMKWDEVKEKVEARLERGQFNDADALIRHFLGETGPRYGGDDESKNGYDDKTKNATEDALQEFAGQWSMVRAREMLQPETLVERFGEPVSRTAARMIKVSREDELQGQEEGGPWHSFKIGVWLKWIGWWESQARAEQQRIKVKQKRWDEIFKEYRRAIDQMAEVSERWWLVRKLKERSVRRELQKAYNRCNAIGGNFEQWERQLRNDREFLQMWKIDLSGTD